MKLLDRPLRAAELPVPEPEVRPRTARAWTAFATVGLLLVAAALRLARLDLVQYREDDDALWTIVTRIARTGSLPVTGMHSSIGLPNGPFQAWLLAPFALVGATPPIMTAGVGLLNVLGVALVYGFARDFFGKRVALVALLLVAVNPWAVVLSRRLWGDDLVAPFSALTLWMLGRWLCRRDGRALVVGAAALAIVGQVYIVGLEWLAPAALTVALSARRLLSRWGLAGAAVFGVLTAPYVFGAALARLASLQNIGGAQDGRAPVLDLTSLKFAVELASNEGYQSFALQGGSVLDATSGAPGALGIVARALYATGLAIGLWALFRGEGPLLRPQRGIFLLMTVAVIVPAAVLVRHAVPVYPYYLVASIPVPYVCGALAVDRLWTWAGLLAGRVAVAARGAVAAALGATVAMDLALAAVFFAVAGTYYPDGNYGMPWRMVDRLARETRALEATRGPTRVLVPEHSEDPNVLFRALAQYQTPGVDPSDDTEFDDRRMLVLSGRGGLYVVVGAGRAQRALAEGVGSRLVASEVLPGEGVVVRWYALPPDAAAASPPAGATPLEWSLGGVARLDGVALPRRVAPGTPFDATVYLSVPGRPDPTVPNFSIFAHLVRPDGKAVAQRDEPVWETTTWRAGDRVIQWLSLEVPKGTEAGMLSASVGMYSTGSPGRPGLRPLDVTDATGRSLGTSPVAAATSLPPAAPAAPERALAARFAEGIGLEGYDLARDGGSLIVTPHWTAAGTPSRDYTAFVHLLDASGKLVAQQDAQPLGGGFPTSFWRAGDRIADPHRVELPPGLPPGSYRLEFGLYELATLRRLPAVEGSPEAGVNLP